MATFENPGGKRPGATGSSSPNAQASNQDNGQDNGNVAQQARRQVHDLVDEAKDETSRMAGQAGDLVQGLIGKQKDQAVERLGGVAGALREVGNRLQDEDGAGFGEYAVRAADQVDRLSGYLRDRDFKTFVRDTESFARRHPDVFLGGTFVAGLVLARFLKSSSANREDDRYEGGYSSPRESRRGSAASYPETRYGGESYGGGVNRQTGPYGSPTGVTYPDAPEGA